MVFITAAFSSTLERGKGGFQRQCQKTGRHAPHGGDAQFFTRPCSVARFCGQAPWNFEIASCLLTTSPYLLSMSNRFASWGAEWRSPTHSRTTMVLNPCCTASTAVARMQPLVEQPASTTVSMPWACNIDARLVPKNELAYCLLITTSSAVGSTSSQNAASGLPSTMSFMTGAFLTQIPPSAKCPA